MVQLVKVTFNFNKERYGTSVLCNRRAVNRMKECWQKNRGAKVTAPSIGFFGNSLRGEIQVPERGFFE